jgi:hypothetical protein
MIVSIHQPAYLPWLGYFHRIAVSDLHIVLDSVQFEKNSFTNRNKVRTANGWCWLTVPVRTSGLFGALAIDRVEIETRADWQRKHWQTLRQNYGRAPYFAAHAPFFEELYACRWTRLADLCQAMTVYLLKAFGIATPLRYSSQMESGGAKDELILNLCREAGATTYLSGALGRNYLREQLFREAGIEVVYQDYAHPVYPQTTAPFLPYMAAIDLLFHCGPRSLEILRNEPRTLVTA